MGIRRAREEDIPRLYTILKAVVHHMHQVGFDQWNDDYPTCDILERDVTNGTCYLYTEDETIVGFITLDDEQPQAYDNVDFRFGLPCLCVHRLAIDPAYQRRGIARTIMHFAESHAKDIGCTAIRLDTREDNQGSLKLYKTLDYVHRGHIHYPGVVYKFPCMEKKLL